MIQICRHILDSGTKCQAPALKDKPLCRHHHRRHALLARARRAAGEAKAIPFVFPEDRASIQTNLFLVLHALAEGKIDNQTANVMTRTLRVAAVNLGKTPLIESDPEEAVQRVILTPEGDEIAPPREQLEAGEAAPLHHKNCPCQRCAEQYRGAVPEQHHPDCQCGLCEPATPSAAGDSTAPSIENSEESIAKRTAPAEKLYKEPAAKDAASQKLSLYDYLHGDAVHQHEAQHAARVKAALEAGIDPPVYEPFRLATAETEADRRQQEEDRQIEASRQHAKELWRKRYGAEPESLGGNRN